MSPGGPEDHGSPTAPTAPTALRVAWLVVGLALRRLHNRFRARAFGGSGSGASRVATAKKKPTGSALVLVMSGLFLLNGVVQSARVVHQVGSNAQRDASPAGHVISVERAQVVWPSRDAWYGPADSPQMLRPLALLTFLISVSIVLLGFAGADRDLAKVEWTFEWWFTFPVSARGLLLARVFETAFASPLTWLLVFPFFSVVFYDAGLAGWSLPAGLMALVYLGLLSGSVRVVAETGLRRFLSSQNVARVQAVLSVLAYVPFFSVIACTIPEWQQTLIGYAKGLPTVLWTSSFAPLGMAMGGRHAWVTAASCAGAAAVITFGAVTFGSLLLQDGLIVSSGPIRGERGQPTTRRSERRSPFGLSAHKELAALFRDRTRFAQTFLAPVVFVGMQVLTRRGAVTPLGSRSHASVTLAFATAASVLLSGACNGLIVEVPALWMYFSLPRGLERLLFQKAVFWSSLACIIALLVFASVSWGTPEALASGAPLLLLALCGVVLNAFIATGIGVLGTNPLDSEPRRRIPMSMSYLFMLIVGLFTYALYAPSVWAKVVQVVLSTLLAFALWQKVRDHVPLLLDPTERPLPSIAVADGVIAALSFFVLQGLIGLILLPVELPPGGLLLLAFTGAGLLVAGGALLIFASNGLPDLLGQLGLRSPEPGWFRGLLWGFGGGLCASAAARGYLWLVERVPYLRQVRQDSAASASEGGRGLLPWFIVLAVVAAPLFEELIFRGLLYRGFRRTFTPSRAALASAAVFAIIHPPIAAAPVFVLGLFAAFSYERTRSLLVPVLTHATYNAIVVVSALLQHR